jgi:hypothetical protein
VDVKGERGFPWATSNGDISRAMRWYCKYGISYRGLEETLTERQRLLVGGFHARRAHEWSKIQDV